MTREHPGLFLAPAAVTLGAVALFPALAVLWLSLEERSPLLAAARFVGFDNYTRLIADARFWNALANTVYFSAVSVALEVLLGLLVALLLARAFRGRALLYSIILLPWAIPTVVSARLWEWLYNADYGVLNYLLGTHVNWLGSPGWALHAAILMDVWKATPFVALLLIAGLQTIPRELYQAAALDGAGAWTTFRRITLPLLVPLLLVVLVFRTIDAFRVFDAIYVLTGGGPANSTETVSIYAYKVLFQALEFGYGSAVAVSVLAVVALLTAVYARLLRGSMT
ncbi:MAG: ABC transporter permease [Acidithiobacillales bacterium SM1_46]|jgi:multiple sugar transport system permease protein|nr:MAG: ABC transporter permease [Acidithiobacillales bacterium SM1_46]